MLCSRPASLKQRAPNDLLLRHGRKPSREAGSFYGQLQSSRDLRLRNVREPCLPPETDRGAFRK